MITGCAPKFSIPAGATDNREGSGFFLHSDYGDGYTLVIDGFDGGDASKRLIKMLKDKGYKRLWLALSHPHYDHYKGLTMIMEDSFFDVEIFYCYNPETIRFGIGNSANGRSVKEDYDNFLSVISKAKKCGAEVVYLNTGHTITIGDITFKVWRKQPQTFTDLDDGNAYAFINNGSLCFYFPELNFLTSGDGPENIKEAVSYFDGKVNIFQIPHHGNSCSKSNAEALKAAGAKVGYETNIERKGPGTTGFTAYGAKRVKEAGIAVVMADNDTIVEADNGHMAVINGTQSWDFDVPYIGAWTRDTTGWKYKNYKNGWYQIAGKWYHFNSKGYTDTRWYKNSDGYYRYLNQNDKGAMLVKRWLKVGTSYYWLDSYGRRLTNCAVQVDGKWYYLASNGARRTGWFKAPDGYYRFCDPYMITNSWVSGIYYVDGYGRRVANTSYKIDGKWYYFDKNGKVIKGWKKLKDANGNAFNVYLTPAMLVNCTQVIAGKTYYFDGYGKATEVKKNSKPNINMNNSFKGYNVSTRKSKIQYIVLHYTGAEGTAKDNVNYFNGGNRNASADFFVGHDGDIWQYNPDISNKYSWHCGGGRQSTKGGSFFGRCMNSNSIGIEMCTHKVGSKWVLNEKTLASAAQLVGYLMDVYDIPIDRIIRHFDVTGKNCPGVDGWGYNGGDGEWLKWKQRITSSPSQTPTDPKMRFIAEIGALAREDMRKNGVCAAITVAQAILESAYGTSDLAVNAKNIFGMKCSLSGNTWSGSTWDGKSAYRKNTGEFYSGSYTTVKADFRAYKSWAESVGDHSAYLLGAKNGGKLRYDGLKGENDYVKAAKIIKAGGYATSPDYVTKLCNLVTQYNLTQFNT